jgi:hypothetical protein
VNTFTLEIFDDQGSACCFYTVKWEHASRSEADKFFEKYENHPIFQMRLNELAMFIYKKIGDEMGALEALFKFENQAHALPPTGEYLVEDIYINYGNFPLRLYCLRISETLVVLFNGGEKTASKAQGGNTSMAFNEANTFANRILTALHKKEICITNDQRGFCNYDGSNEIVL